MPPGLYRHGRQYRARIPAGPWVYFGTEYVAAMRGYAAWRSEGVAPDSLARLLDLFTTSVCAGLVRAERIAPRTARDYARDAGILKAAVGHIPVASLRPMHTSEFRDARAQDAPSHVRNEIACLSAALAWAVEAGKLDANPCLQIDWPSKRVRTRLVTDDEYLEVYARAGPAVKLAMALAVRTLALPADVLKLGPRNVIRSGDKRVLRFGRGKTGTLIEIELVGELARLIDAHLASEVVYSTFVHRRDGKPFTVDGIGAMFRRHCVGTKSRPAANPITDFGLRDLRAKGATDEYRAGRPIRELQILLGHKSVKTTEIYLKSLVPETVRPNERATVASVK